MHGKKTAPLVMLALGHGHVLHFFGGKGRPQSKSRRGGCGVWRDLFRSTQVNFLEQLFHPLRCLTLISAFDLHEGPLPSTLGGLGSLVTLICVGQLTGKCGSGPALINTCRRCRV